MTEPAIFCEKVTKQYGSKCAVNELDLALAPGRVIGILGPNGAGKSTLFRLLVGLVRPDRGTVRVLGQLPGWQANGQIAYLPDRARWYPDHTVDQAFRWGETFLPSFDRRMAERLADFMKLDLSMRVGGMSRGQEARLMLILCIARHVPLIILDEPFSGIDVISRGQIIEALIDHLSERESTVLMSTHEIYEAERLLDVAVFLDEGRVILSGETDDLRRKHGSMQALMQTLYR
ncbi:MAG: ABC transporter ATP-binding protein [Alicyclobacillaceae bacterium]|nr:ABC transporter ATP-binding protein [Alicyclobacillaceae bacterium]